MKPENSDVGLLSPEQRLELLEDKVGSNKIGLFAIAIVLIIIISVAATIGVLKLIADDKPTVATAAQLQILETQLSTLHDQVFNLDTKVSALEAELVSQNSKIANTSNQVLLAGIIEQEQDIQSFLSTLRSGMYDLSHMVPGSRSWLDIYNEELNKADRKSGQRIQRLRELAEGANNKLEDF